MRECTGEGGQVVYVALTAGVVTFNPSDRVSSFLIADLVQLYRVPDTRVALGGSDYVNCSTTPNVLLVP